MEGTLNNHENGNNVNTVLCGVILKELKEIIEIDYNETSPNELWDGTVNFSGVKRMIYGLWNDGKNESNEDMLRYMSPTAELKYRNMMAKYKDKPRLEVFL